MVQYHNFTILDIENMYPYERDVYVFMIQEKIAKEKEAQAQH